MFFGKVGERKPPRTRSGNDASSFNSPNRLKDNHAVVMCQQEMLVPILETATECRGGSSFISWRLYSVLFRHAGYPMNTKSCLRASVCRSAPWGRHLTFRRRILEPR